MGWTILQDENDNEIGIVGDEIWDMTSDMIDDLLSAGQILDEDEVITAVKNGGDGNEIIAEFKKNANNLYNRRFHRDILDNEIAQSVRFVYRVTTESFYDKHEVPNGTLLV